MIGPQNGILYYEVPSLIKITKGGKSIAPNEYTVEVYNQTWQKERLADSAFEKTDTGLLIHAGYFICEIVIKNLIGKVILREEFKTLRVPDRFYHHRWDTQGAGNPIKKYIFRDLKGFVAENFFYLLQMFNLKLKAI